MNKMPFFFNMIPILMVMMAGLMISSVPYMAMKKFKPNRPKSLQIVTFMLLGVLLIITYPQNTIFIIFLGYLLSGIAVYLWRYWRLRKSLINSFRLKRTVANAPDKNDATK
jgi:phosphatidylserine synthase